MGTIAEKLTYLDGTKQALKESINNIGGDITSETTFREYATELDNIYDNLPKTTGEGTNLSLTTLKGKMNTTLKGDIEQETREGYNLFQAKLQTTTANGITVTNNNDGTFTINGTNTSTSLTTFRLDQSTQNGTDNLQNYEDGTYTLDLGIANENIQITLMQVNTWQQFIATGMNVRLKSGTITGATGMFIYIAIKGSATINNVTIKPMFVKGSYTTSTIPSFEEYGQMPSPSFPSDIEVVTGTQEVKVENVNLFEDVLEGYNINSSGAFTQDSSYNMNIAKVIEGQTYVYSNDAQIVMGYYNTKPTTTSTTIDNSRVVLTSGVHSFTALYSGYVAIRSSSSAENLQLEKGTTRTPYTPHQEQTQIVSLGDIELCKIGNYQDYLYKTSGKNLLPNYRIATTTTNGITYTNNGNGTAILNGTSTAYTQFIDTNSFELEAGTYTLWNIQSLIAVSGLTAQLRNADGTTTIVEANTRNTFTLTETTELKFRVVVTSGKTMSNVLIAPMIIKDTNTTIIPPYEPYGSGIWYKKENVAKINCKNTDTWYKSSSTAVDKFYMRTPYPYYQPIIYDNIGNKCNYFTYKLGTSDVGKFNLGDNSGYLSIFFNYSTYGTTTLNDFKTWVGTIDLTCYLPLQVANDIQITNTTLIEQLDNLEKLKSYNGVTNINCSGNLSAILNVSALKGE